MRTGKAMDTAVLSELLSQNRGNGHKGLAEQPWLTHLHPPPGELLPPALAEISLSSASLCISLSGGDSYSDSASCHLAPCYSCLLSAASQS